MFARPTFERAITYYKVTIGEFLVVFLMLDRAMTNLLYPDTKCEAVVTIHSR